MVIEIDEEQRELLRDLVGTRLRNLSSEIRHTDRPPVRQSLRDERELLRELSRVLEPAAAATG